MRSRFTLVGLLLVTSLSRGQEPSFTTVGIVQELTSAKLTIVTDDHRAVWYQLSEGVLDGQSPLGRGERIEVTSSIGWQDRYVATWIQRVSPQTQIPSTEAPVPAARPEDAAITSARKATAQFVAELPSFQVRRATTRFAKEGRLARWHDVDVVTSTLIYKGGLETYSDIHVGSNEFEGPLEALDGMRSTGEFGKVLLGIFAPEAKTSFGRPRQVALRGRESLRYPFTISRAGSTWKISTPSQSYFTAYSGELWIDRETSRVLRVEMEARDLPRAFPLEAVEMTVDYGFVTLEAGDRFLLPTQAEALNCVRGTNTCLRNETVFTDYIKFEADSKIIFESGK